MKERIDKRLEEFRQKHNFNLAWFIRYMLGGVFTFAAEMAVYFLLSIWTRPIDGLLGHFPERLRCSALGEADMWAIGVSNIISYVVNYFISKYWVFRSPETKHRRDAMLFVLACAANFAVVIISARLILLGLGYVPLRLSGWEDIMPLTAKLGSNAVAFVTVLIFKRFIIWSDTSKY